MSGAKFLSGLSLGQASGIFLKKNTLQVAATDFLRLGAAPGSAAGINIDANSFAQNAIEITNANGGVRTLQIGVGGTGLGTGVFTITATNLKFGANNLLKWTILSEAAGTSSFLSESTTARIVQATSGTFSIRNAANSADRLIVNDAGQIGAGAVAASAIVNIDVSASLTATGGLARALRVIGTLVAAANNDTLTGAFIAPAITPGAFTGLQAVGARVAGVDVSGFTSPGNPITLDLAGSVATGAAAAYTIKATAPSGATTNYGAFIDGITNVCASTGTPAGGSTSARLIFGTTAGFGIYYGSGAPSVSAAKGSWYLRSDGSGTTNRAYVNTDGATTWTAFTTVA